MARKLHQAGSSPYSANARQHLHQVWALQKIGRRPHHTREGFVVRVAIGCNQRQPQIAGILLRMLMPGVFAKRCNLLREHLGIELQWQLDKGNWQFH
ncbi:hypothetical protein [Rhodanobacter koreensis]